MTGRPLMRLLPRENELHVSAQIRQDQALHYSIIRWVAQAARFDQEFIIFGH